MHPYLDLGFLTLPSMGVCILIGTIACLVTLSIIRKYSVFNGDALLDGVLWAIICGFIGMKILYWITDPDALYLNFENWPLFWDSLKKLIGEGMVFYGGLIGGIIGILLVCLRKKRNIFTYTDLFAPCFCLAHAGGRVGCHLSGCCYGMPYEGACSIHLHGVDRLPVQLMEAAFLVLLSITLILILRKNKHRGTVTSFYLILYAVWRFIIEFFRDDPRGTVGALSTSQFIGIFILIAGIALFVISRKWPKDDPLAGTLSLDEIDSNNSLPEDDAATTSTSNNDSSVQEETISTEMPADNINE